MSSKRKNTPTKLASTETHIMDIMLNKQQSIGSPGGASTEHSDDNDCDLSQGRPPNGVRVTSPAPSSDGSVRDDGSESPGSDRQPRSKKQRILQSVMRRSPSPMDNNNMKKEDEDLLRRHLHEQEGMVPEGAALASIEAALNAPGSTKDKQARLNAMIQQLQSIKERLNQVRHTLLMQVNAMQMEGLVGDLSLDS